MRLVVYPPPTGMKIPRRAVVIGYDARMGIDRGQRMAARFFGFLWVAAIMVLAAAPAEAIDTNISGAELLARCQGTPALLKSDQLYCKGYLEGIEDMVAEARAQGKPGEFCVPTGGVSDDQLRQAYIKWGQANASEMRQSAREAVLTALRATYPCQ